MVLAMKTLSARDVPAVLQRALVYTLASLTVFVLVLLALRYGEAFRLSEAWYSPQAVWRNVEATWTEFLRLGVLVLLPASLLGSLGRSELASHGIAALATVALALLWSMVGGIGGSLAMLPAALGGIVLVAIARTIWRGARRHPRVPR